MSFPKMALSVQTGMLTSLCAVTNLIFVGHRIFFSDTYNVLTRNIAARRLTRRSPIHIFLLLAGPTYVHMGYRPSDGLVLTLP